MRSLDLCAIPTLPCCTALFRSAQRGWLSDQIRWGGVQRAKAVETIYEADGLIRCNSASLDGGCFQVVLEVWVERP